ncbi:MAG: hypothetical protein FWG20_02540 [Candidatus Cloacimonetes bacterium]|nr:hypothetical protein [Candidatus Cloacimonadota bacterium]
MKKNFLASNYHYYAILGKKFFCTQTIKQRHFCQEIISAPGNRIVNGLLLTKCDRTMFASLGIVPYEFYLKSLQDLTSKRWSIS